MSPFCNFRMNASPALHLNEAPVFPAFVGFVTEIWLLYFSMATRQIVTTIENVK